MIFKNTNFSEKTAWIMVFLTLFMALYYGYGITQLTDNFASDAGQILWLWIETTVVSIVLIVIVFIALRLLKGKGSDDEFSVIDERDELIESKATFWAYFNLHSCIAVLLVHVFCQALIVDYPFFPNVPPIDFLIHGLFFTSVFVELVLSLMKIYRYQQAASL